MPPIENRVQPASSDQVAAQNIARSNTTSNLFLGQGVRQYAWMNSGNTGACGLVRTPSNVQVQRSLSGVAQNHQLASAQKSPTTPAPLPQSFPLASAPTTQQPLPAQGVSAYLPSPPTSEQLLPDVANHFNNATTPSTSADVQTGILTTSGSSGDKMATSALNKKRLGSTSIGPIPKRLHLNTQIDTQNIVAPATPITRPNSAVVNSEASALRTTMTPLTASPMMRPIPEIVNSRPSAPQRAMPPSTQGIDTLNQRMRIPSIHATLPDLPGMVPGVEAFLEKIGQQTLTGGVNMRLGWFKGALQKRDFFFVVLHQLYCLLDVAVAGSVNLPNWGEHQMQGIKLLEPILMPNTIFVPEVRVYLAAFPDNVGALYQNCHWYRETEQQVRQVLFSFSYSWTKFRDNCLQRGCPPWAEEMVDCLGVHSPCLQHILFTYVNCQLDGIPGLPWTQESMQLLLQSQVDSVMPEAQQIRGWRPGRVAERCVRYRLLRQQGLGISTTSSPVVSSTPTQTAQGFPVRSPGPQRAPQRIHGTQVPCPSATPNSAVFPGQPVLPPNGRMITPAPPMAHNQVGNAPQAMSSGRNTPQVQSPILAGTGQYAIHGHVSHHMTLQQAYQPPQVSPAMVLGSNMPRAIAAHDGPAPTPPGTAPNTPQLFYARPGAELLQTTVPMPARTALHQAHLASPIAKAVDRTGKQADIRLYQYLFAFAMKPVALGTHGAFYEWQFNVPKPNIKRKAPIAAAATVHRHTVRWYKDQAILYRLRCAITTPSVDLGAEHEWNALKSAWPSSCFVSLNGHQLEVRRKIHHGKDLALDLTDIVVEGVNTLQFSLLRGAHEISERLYAVAVEVIEIGDECRIREAIKSTTSTAALASMISAMKGKDGDDDDLMVVNPDVSIDLIDPFTAKIFTTPVRGRHCLHRECFDLDTFLQTRQSRAANGPTSPDEWKCPLCDRDARPVSLVRDGFLQQVREMLETRGGLQTRAILLKADGTWEVKDENSSDRGRSASGRSRSKSVTNQTSKANTDRQESMVVALDDA